MSSVSAIAARNPSASATKLDDAAGAATSTCPEHGLVLSSSGGPHRMAPAPAALGPDSGSCVFGDLCRAPPSKATRYRAALVVFSLSVRGGSGPRTKALASMSLVAQAASLQFRHSGHMAQCHSMLLPFFHSAGWQAHRPFLAEGPRCRRGRCREGENASSVCD